MEGVVPGFAGSFVLVLASGRLRRFVPLALQAEVGLVPFLLFVAVLLALGSEAPLIEHGLLYAAAAVSAWGIILALAKQESSLHMLVGDALGAAAMVASGLRVDFLTAPSGGFIYLAEPWRAPLTWGWLLGFVALLRLANRLPGLFPGVASLLCYLLIGSLLYQKQHPGAAFVVLAVLAGMSTAMWVGSFAFKDEEEARLGRISCSLWSLTLGAAAILSSSKKVATLAVLAPAGLALAPLVFFTVVIARSYFVPRLQGHREARPVIRVALSRERVVGLMLLFCLLVNLLTLLALFVPSRGWALGLGLAMVLVFAKIASLVLFPTRPRRLPKGRGLEILGVPFVRRSIEKHLARIETWLGEPRPHLVVTPDSLAILRAQEEPEYAAVLARADLVLPDGAGVIWAGDFLFEKPVLEQIPGVEFAVRLLELAARTGAPVYLLGTTDPVLAAAREAFAARWPGLRVVGARNGFFSADEAPGVADGIRATGAAICLVAMGVPRQELFMSRFGERTGARVLMGVGGTLDVLSGSVQRAPLVFQRLGLEWLYRVLREPHRLSRAAHLPRFVLRVLEAKVRAGSAPAA